MYEKMLKLKDNKKWLFYLLIIPFGLLFLYNLYNKYIIRGVKKAIQDAEGIDKKLTKKIEDTKQKALEEHGKAKKIEEKINNTTIDKDWHLK
jgi:predicted negative regulator of RcsB-dependent stress response